MKCVRVDVILTFVCTELTIGRVLGRGGFCAVSEVVQIQLQTKASKPIEKQLDELKIHAVVQNRNFMAAHHRRGKDSRYAIKILQDSVTQGKDANLFVNGVVDLAVEARFLAVIRHPNISTCACG